MADALCFSAALAAGVEGGGGGVGTGGEGVAGVSSSEKDDSRTQVVTCQYILCYHIRVRTFFERDCLKNGGLSGNRKSLSINGLP